MFTKEYRVPPGFLDGRGNTGGASLNQPAARPLGGTGGTGKDTQESTGGRLLVTRETAKDFLAAQGVAFPTGASANFLPQSSRLIVRNTQENLDLVDAIVEQASVSGPLQVEIEAKFVEITQNNLKELGFDWLLGEFNIGNERVFGGGGTSGTSPTVNPGDFPFIGPNGEPIGQIPVTGGNRSGNLAISANAIDALLFGVPGAGSLAPGIFGVGGVFTDPQFQVVIRALNQKKGVDLLSAPRVTTKSGQRAVIEIIREFRYPTEFEPPQIPQTFGAARNGGDDSRRTRSARRRTGSLPGHPDDADRFRNPQHRRDARSRAGRRPGRRHDRPEPGAAGRRVRRLHQLRQPDPYRHRAQCSRSVSAIRRNVITPNIINQPIFSTRKVTTSVSVLDGQTVVLGGLMREDVQKIEDTPIIGDIPLVGRLFRSNAEQHLKRNLVIFVSARLINPGGQLVNQTDEVEETEDFVQPPQLPAVPMYKK